MRQVTLNFTYNLNELLPIFPILLPKLLVAQYVLDTYPHLHLNNYLFIAFTIMVVLHQTIGCFISSFHSFFTVYLFNEIDIIYNSITFTSHIIAIKFD